MVTGNKLAVEVSNSHIWTWGENARYKTQYTAASHVKTGPRKSVRASSMVSQGLPEVPYTMHLSTKRAPGVKVQTTGTRRGISSWDRRHIITTVNSPVWV